MTLCADGPLATFHEMSMQKCGRRMTRRMRNEVLVGHMDMAVPYRVGRGRAGTGVRIASMFRPARRKLEVNGDRRCPIGGGR